MTPEPTAQRETITVVGWDKFGRLVAEQLIAAGKHVHVLSAEASTVEAINHGATDAIQATHVPDLGGFHGAEHAALQEAEAAFVNQPSDREKLIYIFNLRRDFPDLKVIAPVNNANLQETFIAQANVFPLSRDEISAKIFSSYLFERDVATLLSDILSPIVGEDEHDIQQFPVQGSNPFLGRPYGETFVAFRTQFQAVLIGLSKHGPSGHTLLKNPGDATLVEDQDFLIAIVNQRAAASIREAFGLEPD
jgi:Trk K+ transport system NAD-binding subunit